MEQKLDRIGGTIINEAPMYYVDEAIEFIHERSGLSKKMISRVLELEEDYMRSLGLIVELED